MVTQWKPSTPKFLWLWGESFIVTLGWSYIWCHWTTWVLNIEDDQHVHGYHSNNWSHDSPLVAGHGTRALLKFLGFPDFCVLKKKMKLCAEGHVTLLFCILFVTSHQMSINIVRRKLPSQFTMSSRPYPIIPQAGSFPASWIIVCYGNVMVLYFESLFTDFH